MADVLKHPRLQRRGARYWFRCRVPFDLFDHYRKREITRSLGTGELREALRLVRRMSAAQEAEFDRIRAGRTIVELTDAQVEALTEEHYVNVLLLDQTNRDRGLPEGMYDLVATGTAHRDDIFSEALARGDIEPVCHLIDIRLKAHGITLPVESMSYRALGIALLQAVLRANGALRARNEGRIVPTPRPPVDVIATSARQRATA